MKKCLHPLFALLVLASTAIDVCAQSASTDKKSAQNAAPRFSIEFTRVDSPDLVLAKQQLDAIARRHKVGKASQEEVNLVVAQAHHAEQRTPWLMNVQSAGGPLSEFVKLAGAADKMTLTVINAADPADLETPIPPFNLRNANLGTVINVLATFLLAHGLELKIVGGDNPHPPDAKSLVCVLNRTEAARAESKRAAQTEFESLPLSEHIHGAQTIETIVDAIRTAWELDPARDPIALRLKFHPATKLLLVSGPAPAGLIAQRVVSGLQKKPAQR